MKKRIFIFFIIISLFVYNNVEALGKNIVDKTQATPAGIKNETAFSSWGSVAFSNTWVKTYLRPSTTYTLSMDVECTAVPTHDSNYSANLGFNIYSGVTGYSTVTFYHSQYLNVGEIVHVVKTFTTPATLHEDAANYSLRAYTNRYKNGETGVNGTMIFRNIQIEKGTVATPYEPFIVNAPLPAGYDRLEYIESTGAQYINTGVKATDNLRIVGGVTIKNHSSNEYFGVSANSQRAYIGKTTTGTVYRFGVGTKIEDAGTVGTNDMIDALFSTSGSKFSVNGGTPFSSTGTYTPQPTVDFFLFALNNGSAASSHTKMQLYSMQMYQDGVLVREFVPCRSVTSEIGLYDAIQDVFYPNLGTGADFIAGAEIPDTGIDLNPTFITILFLSASLMYLIIKERQEKQKTWLSI